MFQNIKILHIVDDEKFIDYAYKWFEIAAPSCNQFIIPSNNKKLKYIKKTPVTKVHFLSFKNPYFMKSLEHYDIIILHSLTRFNQEVVVRSSPNIKFVWIGMGYDYYDLIYDNANLLYKENTRKFMETLKNNENRSLVDVLLYKIRKLLIYKETEKKLAVERINFFAPVLEKEYNMVSARFCTRFPKYIGWNYGTSTEMIKGDMKHLHINGNNILLGNSATPENNHYEILEFLSKQELNGKKIVCPLSYGNHKYANFIDGKGKIYFGEDFVSLENFISHDEYMKTISSCSNVIMNHLRQQGGGNISAMLYLGAKVFLNKDNPLYTFHKERGTVLFSIEELYKNPSLLDTKLTLIDINKNREIIKNNANEKVFIDKTIFLIKEILHDK